MNIIKRQIIDDVVGVVHSHGGVHLHDVDDAHLVVDDSNAPDVVHHDAVHGNARYEGCDGWAWHTQSQAPPPQCKAKSKDSWLCYRKMKSDAV